MHMANFSLQLRLVYATLFFPKLRPPYCPGRPSRPNIALICKVFSCNCDRFNEAAAEKFFFAHMAAVAQKIAKIKIFCYNNRGIILLRPSRPHLTIKHFFIIIIGGNIKSGRCGLRLDKKVQEALSNFHK